MKMNFFSAEQVNYCTLIWKIIAVLVTPELNDYMKYFFD